MFFANVTSPAPPDCAAGCDEISRQTEAAATTATASLARIAAPLNTMQGDPFRVAASRVFSLACGDPERVALHEEKLPHYEPARSGSAKDKSVAPEAMTTCCRPSSRYVIGAAPQMGLPVAYRQRFAPVRASNAMTLPSLSPANTSPDAVVITPAIEGDG